MKILILIAAFAMTFTSSAFADVAATLTSTETATLQTLIESDTRSERTRARNKYRHPLETLTFFWCQKYPNGC